LDLMKITYKVCLLVPDALIPGNSSG